MTEEENKYLEAVFSILDKLEEENAEVVKYCKVNNISLRDIFSFTEAESNNFKGMFHYEIGTPENIKNIIRSEIKSLNQRIT